MSRAHRSGGLRARPGAGLGALALACMAASLSLAACELEEITLVEAEDVVVAEVFVQLDEGANGEVTVRAFLHRTLSTDGASVPVPGARVTIAREDGGTLELGHADLSLCVETLPLEEDGSCYWMPPQPGRLVPGERLELEVALPDGGVLTGVTTVPGDFALVGVPPHGTCRQPVDTPLELRWTRSEGAWAYVNETSIHGLRTPFAAEGIDVDDDLYLLGLSVSSSDTTIVFPGEFGVFNRFELEQDVALRLQRGLPAPTHADVTITATDRNYVNWVRGGSFNPSGQVRLPSVRGDGTGVFGSVVVKHVGIVVDPDDPFPSACPS